MNRTDIEYLDFSWNPIAMRCTPVSEGCANCWHLRMANRLAGNERFHFDVRRAYAGEGPPVLVTDRLMKPLGRKKPARIGVQFMGDLFHENVPEIFIDKIFSTMRRASQHTFQILTKRPSRMADILNFWDLEQWEMDGRPSNSQWNSIFPNICLGVSVENQQSANGRREYFRQIPAAIKSVSYEPALGPIDWTGWEFVDQIISGGESGPNARPSHPDWHRATRDFCQQHNIAYFMKQWGAWKPIEETDEKMQEWSDKPLSARFCWLHPRYGQPSMSGPYSGWQMFERVGKKIGGHLLDGQEWREWPDVKS